MSLPVNLNIDGGKCILIGSGESATRKARLLSKSGVRLTVLTCEVDSEDNNKELAALVHGSKGSFETFGRNRRSVGDCLADLLGDCQLCVIACMGMSYSTKQQLASLCRDKNVPVNVVDTPELCSFTFPAMVKRGALTVAISSDGKAPVLARQLRAHIETLLPTQYGDLVELAGDFRARVKTAISDSVLRRRFWENVFSGPVAEHVFSGNIDSARESLENQLATTSDSRSGEVYLVGAGPGDPELLTLRALRLMQKADVVVYDRLVADDIMELVRRDAERIYVGKERANHSTPQDQINELLFKHANEGKRVLRLKGGDPFIFGRGGEEIEHLAAQGINFQVVPGITAAAACASYAGIPLTHRDYAQSVRFITGHLKHGQLDLPWQDLLDEQQTLVFYMGLHAAATISEQLLAHGRHKSTPVAIVESGSTPSQRVLIATLATFPGLLAEHDIRSPSIIIIGSVVQLHEKLAWFRVGDKVE